MDVLAGAASLNGGPESPARGVDWSARAIERAAFIEKVLAAGRTWYRDLPWRNVDDAYAVLVSEVMLQQTQVSRVLRYWPRWMQLFPTVDALASADTATVLDMWQGLGYNRRALSLKRSCELCASQHAGELPRTVDELVKLPGIGPATAAGVVAFAYDSPCTYLETNVRSVFLHDLFPGEEGVSDKQLEPYVADTCPQSRVREWYYALLDYGAHLKSEGANPARRSRHYARQSAFVGSRREKRSFLLRQVLATPEGIDEDELAARFAAFEREAGRAFDRDLFEAVLADLVSEGFFSRDGSSYIP